jgi:hypothetical protein
MTYNRTEAANALLSDIEKWCRRTSTPENSIGHVLFLHPGFVGLLRLRRTLSEEKEAEVRSFLSDNPSGWRGELPKTHANGTRPVKRPQRGGAVDRVSAAHLSEEEIAARRVDRTVCPRCGVRSDFGCNHSQAPLGMVL